MQKSIRAAVGTWKTSSLVGRPPGPNDVRVAAVLLLVCAPVLIHCSADTPPPLSQPDLGVIVGEAFIQEADSLISVGGAVIEVYGTSNRVVSQADNEFVLGSVPVGTHQVSISLPSLQRAVRVQVTIGAAYQTVRLSPEESTIKRSATLSGTLSTEDGEPAGSAIYLVGGNRAQIVRAGSDGGFLLEGLPTGPAQIGFSKAGHDTVVHDLTLEVGANVALPVSLSLSSASGLSISGQALFADQGIHGNLAVSLSGASGGVTVTTDQAGNYEFQGLSPGNYTIKAHADGYRSVILAQVALDASGNVSGLVPMLLARGTDENAGGTAPFDVAITSPAVGSTHEAGSEISFLADIDLEGEAIPPSRMVWQRQGVTPVYPLTEIGRGNPLKATELPVGLHLVRVTATSSGGRVEAHESIFEVVPVQVEVAILSHAFNAILVSQVPVILGAAATYSDGSAVADELVNWGYRAGGTAGPLTALGTGQTITALFDGVDSRQTVDIVVEVNRPGTVVSGGIVGVFLDPFAPDFEFGSETPEAIDPPVTATIVDVDGMAVGTEYTVSEGQPVTLTVSQDLENVVWTSDTGLLVSGARLDLSVLPMGAHLFTLALSDGTLTSEVTLRIVVKAFVFAVSIDEPLPNPPEPYTIFSGVPLAARVSHPYQRNFPLSGLKWFILEGQQPTVNVAQGLRTRTFSLPLGPGKVQFRATDALNHVAVANADYVQQDIEFIANFIQPNLGTSVLEGVPLDFSIAYSHNLVTAANFPSVGAGVTVRYFSDIQGLLTDANGVFDFPMLDAKQSAVTTFAAMVPGDHTLTARVSYGPEFAEASRPIVVRSTGIAASLTLPTNKSIFFQGDNLSVGAGVTADGAVTPIYKWFVDGAEFTSEGGYNGMAETDLGRVSLDLGSVGSGVLGDPGPWGAGSHLIEFSMQIQGANPGRCVNIPTQAVCLTATIDIAPANVDICASTIAETLTGVASWSGVRRLNCTLTINGPAARVEVSAGTRIIVAANTTLRLNQGELIIGSAGTVPEVRIEGPVNSPDNHWIGLFVSPVSNSTVVNLQINNTTIRHARRGLQTSLRFGTGPQTVTVQESTFEDSQIGLYNMCPTSHQNLTFRRMSQYAISTANGYGCGASQTWADLLVEDSASALRLRSPATSVVERLTARDIGDAGVNIDYTQVRSLIVRNSLFERINTDNSSATGAIDLGGQCHNLTATHNIFRNNGRAVYSEDCNFADPGARRIGLFGNVFENNTATAVYDRGAPERAVEIHLNSFSGNNTFIRAGSDGVDIQAQGNFMGYPGDVADPGGFALAQLPGVVGNLPKIFDFFDFPTDERVVRVDNPLTQPFSVPENAPLTYIAEPQRSQKYNVERCVPLRVGAPLGGIDPMTDCTWHLGTTPAAAELIPDADGCIDPNDVFLANGVHSVTLKCTEYDAARAPLRDFVQTVSFRISDAVSGRQWRPTATWSGDILVDGDYTIPAGFSLVVEAGTRIRFALNDGRRFGRRGTFLFENGANVPWGKRNLVELWVNGGLEINGTIDFPVVMEPVSGVAVAGQWGGLRVNHGTAVLQATSLNISGADRAIHGLYKAVDPGGAPIIDLKQLSFTGVNAAITGGCPTLFEDIVVDGAAKIMEEVHCPAHLIINGATFTNIGTNLNTRYIELDNYSPGTTSQLLSMNDVSFDRGVGTRRGYALFFVADSWDVVQIDNSHFKDFGELIALRGRGSASDSLTVSNSKFENFAFLFNAVSSWDLMDFDNTVFNNADRLFYTASRSASSVRFTNNRVSDVDYFFSVNNIGNSNSVIQLVATGNHFENSLRTFYLQVDGSTVTANSGYDFTLSGNNFVGWAGSTAIGPVLHVSAMDLAPQARNNTVTVDLTGSYFDGLTSAGDINTAIFDTVAVAGRIIDTSGAVATPLSLTVPDANVAVPR